MEDKERPAAVLSALTTEHFVLQTAASATVSEASARASIYLLSLSSSLVAMGFASQSREAFGPFLAVVLPALFLMGLLTVIRLVDITLEYRQCLTGIARIRGYYRTLSPEAAEYFAPAHGRWPETAPTPALQLGTNIAFLTTTSTMVAFVNNVVGSSSRPSPRSRGCRGPSPWSGESPRSGARSSRPESTPTSRSRCRRRR